jgi:hypothetical protein
MEQVKKDKLQETEPEAVVASAEEEPVSKEEPVEPESSEKTEELPPPEAEIANVKRGRMVAAGLTATVAVALIALLVAAIFQVTSRWLITCPTDLPVNDPAPVLWKAMVSEKVAPSGLGVSGDVLKETGLKEAESESEKAPPVTKE